MTSSRRTCARGSKGASRASGACALSAAAQAQEPKSAALAKQLAAALDSGKLDSIAAKDPSAPDIFIGALYFPGVQLLVVSAKYTVPALLNEKPDSSLQRRPYGEKPYWDIERARLGGTDQVPVELIVNGYPVARKTIVADGKLRDISFDTQITKSSWIALRILRNQEILADLYDHFLIREAMREKGRSVSWRSYLRAKGSRAR